MKDIKCVRCGLINWAIEEKCLRCGLPLADSAAATTREAVADAPPADVAAVAAEPEEEAAWVDEPEEKEGEPPRHVCEFCGTRFGGGFCTLCRKPVAGLTAPREERHQTFWAALCSSTKAKVGVSLLAGFIVVASVFAFRGVKGVSAAASDAYLTELIQQASVFKHPLSVGFEQDVRGDLGPGVEVLQELGLVTYTSSVLPQRRTGASAWPGSGSGREEETKPGPPPVKLWKVELTPQGLQESQGWEPTRSGVFLPGTTTAAVTGWRVPVGEREFVAIKKISLPYPNVYTLTNVEFTWKWKPNRAGKYFDVNSSEFTSLSPTAQQSARLCRLNDSAQLHTGKAVMTYEEDSWGVESMEFDQYQ